MAVRSLRWVSDYRTDRVDSIKLFFFSSPKYDFLAFQTASLGVGLSYGQGRLHKLFSSYRQNSLPSLVAVRSLRWVSDYRTDRVDSIKLFFFSSPKYDFLAFQTASLGVGLSYGQGRLHKTFFFSSPKYDFLAFLDRFAGCRIIVPTG